MGKRRYPTGRARTLLRVHVQRSGEYAVPHMAAAARRRPVQIQRLGLRAVLGRDHRAGQRRVPHRDGQRAVREPAKLQRLPAVGMGVDRRRLLALAADDGVVCGRRHSHAAHPDPRGRRPVRRSRPQSLDVSVVVARPGDERHQPDPQVRRWRLDAVFRNSVRHSRHHPGRELRQRRRGRRLSRRVGRQLGWRAPLHRRRYRTRLERRLRRRLGVGRRMAELQRQRRRGRNVYGVLPRRVAGPGRDVPPHDERRRRHRPHQRAEHRRLADVADRNSHRDAERRRSDGPSRHGLGWPEHGRRQLRLHDVRQQRDRRLHDRRSRRRQPAVGDRQRHAGRHDHAGRGSRLRGQLRSAAQRRQQLHHHPVGDGGLIAAGGRRPDRSPVRRPPRESAGRVRRDAGVRDRARRASLPPAIPRDRQHLSAHGHHPARRPGLDPIIARERGARSDRRSLLHPRRRRQRPEARDRAQLGGDDHRQLLCLGHQVVTVGRAGDSGIERPGAVPDRQQLPRGVRREHHVRRRGSVHRQPRAVGHHHQAELHFKARELARAGHGRSRT